VASVEREIDKLFALPLEEFTAARNELAKRLAKDGEKERADEVRGLAKPSVPVWTINQLARSEKPMVRALLDAGAKLRRAQEQALGGGNPDALRSAQREEREALRALTHRAGEILREAGKPVGQAVLERINGTLGAAAVTEDAREDLKAGRLTSELRMSGFESLAGFEAPPPRDELAERREQKAERERERRRLEKRARDLERRATKAEERADEAESAAAEAREAADDARQAADEAADELAQFEG
jgi:cell division septum initiation protein DivIVA